ncbi:hypothetical protein GCM10025862_13650 [Arsenicicoccus piscis]|uniref:Alcohol dehydrogenase-like N-terminal domain-containing protein n=1 Tax=Arsenicicoccus piscis TaxID=673954 RepID=A0ABQ6HLM0_9MICO|nr:hypothetical protein GCM10025862_13650 [Arsenicicoccus piscis]
MRALVKTGPHPGLELIDLPEPSVGPTDVKIRVLRAGLCGTDLHLQAWDDWAAATVTPPLILGHEFYGEVVEVGSDVASVQVGQRVSGEGTSCAATAATVAPAGGTSASTPRAWASTAPARSRTSSSSRPPTPGSSPTP